MDARAELVSEGPLARLDRAFALVRRGPTSRVLRAFAGGALAALSVLVAGWVERVEGVHSLRPLLAAGLVLGFVARSHVLSRVAGEYADALVADAPPDGPRIGAPRAVARTALVVAAGLVVWSLPFFLAALGGPLALALTAPLLGLRGLVAPGWLARSARTRAHGVRAFVEAAREHDALRGEGFVTELLLVLGALGLGVNVLLACAGALLVVRTFLGVDLALLDAFFSPRNGAAWALAALLALTLLEPLRAALSALYHVEARALREGLDVRALVERATAPVRPRSGRGGAGQALALVLVCLAGVSLGAPRADAQGAPPSARRDLEVLARAERILEGPAYREFDEDEGAGLRDGLGRLLDAFLRARPEPVADVASLFQGPSLPGPTFFVVAALVVAAVVFVALARARVPRGGPAKARPASRAPSDDPRVRPPEAWLAEAQRLADAGDAREALRAVYLATLVALDRAALLAFDPALTNRAYVRQLRPGVTRETFRELTLRFDASVYGHAPTVHADYVACRALAERLAATGEPAQRGTLP